MFRGILLSALACWAAFTALDRAATADDRGPTSTLPAEPPEAELIDGVWVTPRLTMRHLKHQSFTTLELRSIEPNPELPNTTFELRRLESH